LPLFCFAASPPLLFFACRLPHHHILRAWRDHVPSTFAFPHGPLRRMMNITMFCSCGLVDFRGVRALTILYPRLNDTFPPTHAHLPTRRGLRRHAGRRTDRCGGISALPSCLYARKSGIMGRKHSIATYWIPHSSLRGFEAAYPAHNAAPHSTTPQPATASRYLLIPHIVCCVRLATKYRAGLYTLALATHSLRIDMIPLAERYRGNELHLNGIWPLVGLGRRRADAI